MLGLLSALNSFRVFGVVVSSSLPASGARPRSVWPCSQAVRIALSSKGIVNSVQELLAIEWLLQKTHEGEFGRLGGHFLLRKPAHQDDR
jgi:hypothetical protein